MVEHPAARALTGYLLVRGGVHQVAYARALERLTGADLMKLFPSPRIPTDKIPECQPHIERGEHLKLYRFSPRRLPGARRGLQRPASRDRRGARRRRRAASRGRARARPAAAAGGVRARLRTGGDRRDRAEAPQEGRACPTRPTGLVSEESEDMLEDLIGLDRRGDADDLPRRRGSGAPDRRDPVAHGEDHLPDSLSLRNVLVERENGGAPSRRRRARLRSVLSTAIRPRSSRCGSTAS